MTWLKRDEFLQWLLAGGKFTADEVLAGKAPAIPGPYPPEMLRWIEMSQGDDQ